jgi:hypothetical protein
MKFIANNSSHSTLHIDYKEKYIEETANTKYLGLEIFNHIYLNSHIGQMIPKLNAACYVVMLKVHISNSNTSKSIY